MLQPPQLGQAPGDRGEHRPIDALLPRVGRLGGQESALGEEAFRCGEPAASSQKQPEQVGQGLREGRRDAEKKLSRLLFLQTEFSFSVAYSTR